MKSFFLFILLGLVPSCNSWATECTHIPTAQERAVFEEINRVRENPQDFAYQLEELKSSYHGTDRKMADHSYLITQEGVSAVEEAIRALRATSPRTAFSWDGCLSQSALDHVQDTGPKGLTGHDTSDGKTFPDRIQDYPLHFRLAGENISYGADSAEEIVSQLVIDDGIPGRGHRKNMLSREFNAAGVACGPHAKFGSMCVIDFAKE